MAARPRKSIRPPLQREVFVIQHESLSIAALRQPGQRLSRTLVAFGKRIIQFDDDDGISAQQRLLGAPQHVEIEAVDVYFDAVDPFDPVPVDEIIELVEGIGLYLALAAPQAVDPVLFVACGGARGDLVDLGILDVVVLEIGPQHGRRCRRLERKHAPARGELGKQDRVVAHVGADIEYPPVRANVLDEPALRLQLALGIVVAKLLVKRNELDELPSRDGCFNSIWHTSGLSLSTRS